MAVDFSSLGIRWDDLEGQFPNIADSFTGTLLVVGGGRCVFDDLQAVAYDNQRTQYHVMCINDIVMHFDGPVNHFYSNDQRWIPKWLAARREMLVRAYEGMGKCHVHSNHFGARYNWPWPGHGTSSLNGVYTGLALGYEKIILCGVPLDNSGHYFDPPWKKTNFYNEVAERNGKPRYWENAAKNIFDGRVKSCSGRTRELLGAP